MSRIGPRTVLIKPGSLRRSEDGEILDASSAVTLIVCGKSRIIVDTGKGGEEGVILEALGAIGLSPLDIDIVVSTHSHDDHHGNDWLFENARHLSKEMPLRTSDWILHGVWIMETPGHSKDSISVVCEGKNRIVVSGDALPTLQNFIKRVPPRLHTNRDEAVRSMERIIGLAEIIIPGHDRPFSTKDSRYMVLSDYSSQ